MQDPDVMDRLLAHFPPSRAYDRTSTTTKTKILTSPDAAGDRMREMMARK